MNSVGCPPKGGRNVAKTISFLVATVVVAVLGSCEKEKSDNVTLVGEPERVVLLDSKSPLGEIMSMRSYSKDRILVLDNTHTLQLFRNKRGEGIVGVKGRGPCEYNMAMNFSVLDDTLYVLDKSGGKIVWYSMKTNSCLGEIVNAELTNWSSLVRLQGKFYLIFSEFTAGMNLSKRMLCVMDDYGQMKSLGLPFRQLDADPFIAPLMIKQPIKMRDETIYFFFPTCRNLFAFNTKTESMSKIELRLEGFGGQRNRTVTDAIEIGKRIKNSLEIPFGLYLLKEHICVASKIGEKWYLRFYKYSGQYHAELLCKGPVFEVTDSSFSRYEVSLNPIDADHPFIIIKQRYVLN